MLCLRRLLHVDDIAAASIHLVKRDQNIYDVHTKPMLSHISVSTGVDCSIKALTETVARIVGFDREIV